MRNDEYCLLIYEDNELAKHVTEKMRDGWRPQGGPFVYRPHDSRNILILGQAMVRGQVDGQVH